MGGAAPIVGGVLGLVGASKAAKAQTQAADTAAAAQREATAESVASQEAMQAKALAAQEKALREQRGYLRPYGDAGTQALYQYLYRIGAGAPTSSVYKAAFADPETAQRLADIRAKIAPLTAKQTQFAAQPQAVAGSAPAPSVPVRRTAWTPTTLEEQYRAQTDPAYVYSMQQQAQAQAAEQARAAVPVQAQALTQEEQSQLAQYQAELASLEQQQAATDVGEFKPWNLEESPTYRLQQEDTEKAINRQLLARGLYGSKYGTNQLSDNARRLAASEQAAQLSRLTGLTAMGQEARSGMAAGGLTAANQMTQMYSQGAGNYANIYENMAQGLGSAAFSRGAAQAGLWGNVSDLGGRMMQNYANQQIYGAPAYRAANYTVQPTQVQQVYTNMVDKMFGDYNQYKYGIGGGGK